MGSSTCEAAGLRLGLFIACAAAFLFGPASGALANGTVDVTVTGTGSGTVTSTSQTIPAFGAPGAADATPGEIDCDKAGEPICNATITAQGFGSNTRVTLTAAPDPGGGPFLGWAQSGATSVFGGCTYPAGSPETCAVNLNGNPGPTSTVFAIFGDPPPAPDVVTGASGPGADFSLATLEGAVDPGGFAVTDCYFEYGRTTSYGNTVPCEQSEAEIGNGNDPVPVSASTEPLEPNTTYHYRLVASSEVGDGIGDTSAGQNLTFTTGSAPDSGCPNEDRRIEQGVIALLLPDCMALEMVSERKKEQQYARFPALSPKGDRVLYYSGAAIADPPVLPSNYWNRYLAGRGASGWTTTAAAPSDPTINKGRDEGGHGDFFSADFSRWFHLAATLVQYQYGIGAIYRGGLDQPMSPLSPLLDPLGAHATHFNFDGTFQGAARDHSRLYFSMGGKEKAIATYLPGDPQPSGSDSIANGYIAQLDSVGQPSLQLLARDGNGQVWGGNCGAAVGGTAHVLKSRNQGAVSADGSRAYFTTRPSQPPTGDCNSANRLRILKRVETQAGAWITPLLASECVETPIACDGTTGGDDLYQGASVDGSKVYFTSNRQLADSDTDATSDLYLYDSSMPIGERLIQASAGDEAAKVLTGIPAISGDGTHVYFTSEGALTGDPNPEGAVAQVGQSNLYLYQRDDTHPDGRLAFIATVDPSDIHLTSAESTFRGNAYPVPVTGTDANGNEVGGSGHVLLFKSKASLTADDTDGGFRDIFRYNAKNSTLERVSVAAPGGEDDGPVDVDLRRSAQVGVVLIEKGDNGPDFAEQRRWVSEDGETVVFKTAEGLVPGDRNGITDSYLVRGGQTYRLPGTTDNVGGFGLLDRPVLSHDGSTVAFTSSQQLLPDDGDTAISVYALRVNGGYPFEQEPAVCRGEDCQGPAAGAPAAAGANSTTAPPEGIVRTPGNRCRAVARRAQQLSQQAKRLRRNAKRVRAAGKARQMNRQARRVAKRAQRLSANAKRCRRANRGAVR